MVKIIESLEISTSHYINAVFFILAFAAIAKSAAYLVNIVFRWFARHKNFGMDDTVIGAIHRPVFFSVLAIGVSLVVGYLGTPEKIVFYTDGALHTAVAILWMLCAMSISGTVIENAIRKFSNVTGLSNDIIPLVRNVTKIIILIATLIIVLGVWHVSITPILASAGIAGAAVALAAKDTIANFFGGISIFVDRPFVIGDYIVLEGGERGEVVNIGIRSTKVKTFDYIVITVPNSTIINSKIKNESAGTGYLRTRMPVTAAYGSDIDSVERLLVAIALEDENIVNDPPPQALLTAMGQLGLNFDLICWIKDPLQKPVIEDGLNRRIYRKFGELGIGIPFGPADVYKVRQQ